MGFFSKRIQRTCLNPRFSLRTQMILSFGITAVIAILSFVLIGLYTTRNSGDSVRREASTVLTELIKYSLGRSAQYVAETISKKFDNIGGGGSLMAQATKDRFAGYKSLLWQTDIYVPFHDVESNSSKYPLDAPLLPLDWNIKPNVNPSNYKEHLVGRPLTWYTDNGTKISTLNAAYFMQGSCDPQHNNNPNHPTYYPGCSDANNNVRTGGVVQPTQTNRHIYNKAKDVAWMLKPLYEAQLDVKTIGVYFANEGAGSVVSYPATIRNGTDSYVSAGCDWMKVIHPRSGRRIGTPDAIARCHEAGEVVPLREYNPLERPWCRRQVEQDIELARDRRSRHSINMESTGPYLDPGSDNVWVLTFGRAVFDRLTDNFIACTLLDVSVLNLYTILKETAKIGNSSQAALVRYDEPGTVVVATQWYPPEETEVTYVTDSNLGLGVDSETYNEIYNLVDYDSKWDHEIVQNIYQETILENNDKLIMIHPIPSVPPDYDPNYVPQYLIVISMDKEDAFGVLDEMDLKIDEDVQNSSEQIMIVGSVGFGVILLSIVFISSGLVKPLKFMQKVSGIIVNNAGGTDLSKGLKEQLDRADTEAKPFLSPRTEVTLLLSEFLKMMKSFSGDGAADVAGHQINEVKNTFRHDWRPIYDTLYDWPGSHLLKENSQRSGTLEGGIPKNLSINPNETFDDELTCDSTHVTEKSLFSSVINKSLTASTYTETLDLAKSKSSSFLQSVRDSSMLKSVQKSVQESSIVKSVRVYAEKAAIKAGVMKEPEEEKFLGPPLVNYGPNVRHPPDPMRDYFDGVDDVHKSYLFWWTTFLVGTPIVIAAIMISVTVATDASNNIPTWLADVKRRSIDLELSGLISTTRTRAYFGEEVIDRIARDLHIYTRLAGWLLFGGITRSDAFTWQVTGSETCKVYENYTETCPFSLDDTLSPCPCAWDDIFGENCIENTTTNPRYLQHRWYESLSSDANEYGDRYNTSFPLVDYEPSATNWWKQNTTSLPGSEKGRDASGYRTTYDRIRVLSALSVADFPIYNYYPGKDETGIIGTYLGIEADGMFTGFSGCLYSEGFAFFQSSDGNGAYNVNGTLCPKGKYGYDARCRGWYKESRGRGGHFHITAPYLYAASDFMGMSAGAALEDPATKETAGVALVDFSPSSFINAVGSGRTSVGTEGNGFAVVITPEPDVLGTELVVGPNYTLGDTVPFGMVVLPYDVVNSTNRLKFEELVADPMRHGDYHFARFTRSLEDGTQQDLYMTFAPVKINSLVAVNASDFGAGVEMKETHVYSLGFGITLDDLEAAFLRVEKKVNSDIDRTAYISLTLIILAVLMVMYMTKTLTLYLAQPIIVLVSIVKSIADKTLGDELPKLEGGSCEIYDVYDSLEKVCKIVRFSNASFFKGDRTKSYKFMEEALELFENMGNQKALGIANNNLGIMVLQEQMEKSSSTAKSDEVYFKGLKYFEEAIRIGTYEYQNAEYDDYRGDFVKQLANRYFNRGMFYIVNRTHKMASSNMEEMGVKDIKRAKALDEEAHLYWKERGQLKEQAAAEFFAILRRARGMLTLIQDAGYHDIWGIDDLIKQADAMIHTPIYIRSNLFENVSVVAREQQINDLRMQYALTRNEREEAGKIAMKILVEDEYVIDTVIMNCVTTLNTHFGLHGRDDQVPHLCKGVKRETRRGQVDSMREAKNVIFCLDCSGSMAGERMERANSNLLWMYDEHCLDKDFVGFVRFNHAIDTRFTLARKGGHQDEHKKIIEEALEADGGTRMYAALHHCVKMAMESGNTYDTWIISLTDGESHWDFPSKQVVGQIVKHNKARGPQIHVIVIGFEVSSEVADSVAAITSVTDKSMYIDAQGGLDEMDNAFETVASVITGTAITMETF